MEDQHSDKDFLQSVLNCMSPNWLLKQAGARFTEHGPDYCNRGGIKGYVAAFALAHTSGFAPEAEVLRMNMQAEANKKLFEACPAVQAELGRVISAGVTWKYGGDHDYGYQSKDIFFIVTFDVLQKLEELAADDAGIVDAQERVTAKLMSKRWLLQNYHRDYKAYLDKWPKVERFPYDNAANSFGREPSRVRL